MANEGRATEWLDGQRWLIRIANLIDQIQTAP